MSLRRGFLASCRHEKIPEKTARQLAEVFRDEKGRYPRTFKEVLRGVCE